MQQMVVIRRIGENLLAILLTAITTGILFWLKDALSTPIVALVYLLPVLISTTLWGLGAGVLASVCAFLGFNYFFIRPLYTLTVHQSQDILALVIFLTVAIVISQLIGRIQSSLVAVREQEHLVSELYEFSTSLATLRDIDEIRQRLADNLRTTLQAKTCQVILNEETSSLGEDKTSQTYTIPLETDRGKLGEIRLWRDYDLSPSEEQLAKAFAGQGAVALERATLAQSETRAKILEESDRLKSALLSSVSHDLRTPLVTIKAAATSLHSGEIDWHSQAREELLSALEDEADRLNDIVSNLLNMSRIEAGALHLQKEWNVLAEIVDNTVGRLKRATQHHRLEIDVSEDLPMIQVDVVLLQQVLINLLDNSTKYAPAGTVIRISAHEEGATALLVEIINQGPPVPEEHLQGIFDRFHRVTAADRIPGTGLGLSICKGIIEAHGGRIWAENRADGFAFKFTLPNRSIKSMPDLQIDELDEQRS